MPTPDHNRCTFTFREGRRCRMLCAPAHPAFCQHHLRVLAREQGLALREARPTIVVGDLDSTRAVRRTLKRVAREVALGRMEPWRAALLVNLSRVLLSEARNIQRRRAKRRLL